MSQQEISYMKQNYSYAWLIPVHWLKICHKKSGSACKNYAKVDINVGFWLTHYNSDN